MGRSGHAMAIANWEVQPDILVVGKGLGAGYADVSAVVLNNRIRRIIEKGSNMTPLTHTYGGNPLSLAIAASVIDAYAEDRIVDNVIDLSPILWEGANKLSERFDQILDVRGLGFMIGVELRSKTATGSVSATAAVLQIARNEQLLLYPFNGFLPGESGDGFFLAPPLNSTKSEIQFAIERLQRVLEIYSGMPD